MYVMLLKTFEDNNSYFIIRLQTTIAICKTVLKKNEITQRLPQYNI